MMVYGPQWGTDQRDIITELLIGMNVFSPHFMNPVVHLDLFTLMLNL